MKEVLLWRVRGKEIKYWNEKLFSGGYYRGRRLKYIGLRWIIDNMRVIKECEYLKGGKNGGKNFRRRGYDEKIKKKWWVNDMKIKKWLIDELF